MITKGDIGLLKLNKKINIYLLFASVPLNLIAIVFKLAFGIELDFLVYLAGALLLTAITVTLSQKIHKAIAQHKNKKVNT